MFCKKGVLKNFAKFTKENLHQTVFFNKVAGRLTIRKALVFLFRMSELSKQRVFVGNNFNSQKNKSNPSDNCSISTKFALQTL